MGSEDKESTRKQRAFWEMVVETWQASGLSVGQFCEQEGFSKASFYRWRRKLSHVGASRSDETVKVSVGSPLRQPGAPPSAAFIEVSAAEDRSAPLELELSCGHTLKIAVGTDRQTLSTVLLALQQAGLC